MKNKILHILLISTSSLVFCQRVELASQLIPDDLKKNANAVARNNFTEITIEDQNKMIVYTKNIITVLNKLGDMDARIVEGYDNDTKITKLLATIYDASGNEIKKYSKSKFQDVSAVDGGTLYSDSRVKYIDYTPTTYPYTLVFESEYKTSTTGFIPWWLPINGYHISVEQSQYVINNPKAISWRTKELQFDNFNVLKEETATNISYSIKHQKALKYEVSSPHFREILPKAIITLNKFSLKGVQGSYSNWKEFGVWMNKKLLTGRDQLSEATKTAIKTLVKDTSDPIEKAKLVYKYMQEKTRYISVQVGIGGWEPIAANLVDEVGYGDCKGLTNYTKALMDAAGVTSYYTIVYADEKRDIDKDFTSIQGNHIILNIPNEGEDVWLECTSQQMPFGFLGDFTHDRDVLVVTPEGGVIKRTTAYKDEYNLQKTTATIQLHAKGTVKATIKRTSQGLQYDDKLGYENLSEKELIDHYKRSDWSYINNLEVVNHKLTNDKENTTLTEDLEIMIEDYAAINEQEYLFKVNVFNSSSYVPKRYRNRKLPLKIRTGYKDIDEYKFSLPKGYVIQKLPDTTVYNSKFGSYKIVFTPLSDTSFIYKKEMTINEGNYTKEDYALYRKFRKNIARKEKMRIAIKKIKDEN